MSDSNFGFGGDPLGLGSAGGTTPPGQATKSTFVHRLIDVTFELGKGQFGVSGFDTVTLSGLRVSADVSYAGAPMSKAAIRVRGMTPDQMNQLSTLGMPQIQSRRNTVTVQAGDADSGLATVFVGTIIDAWADFQAMPEVVFHVMAASGLFENIKPVPPLSYRGSADVSTIMQNIAQSQGWSFENNGVSIKLSNPYFPGTGYTQAQTVAKAAGINMILESNTLAIWPPGKTRGGQIPLVSPETGMVRYPSYTGQGVLVQTLYNPSIRFGGQVRVKSSLPQASKTWSVFNVVHNLESEVPGGAWFTRFQGTEPGFFVVG